MLRFQHSNLLGQKRSLYTTSKILYSQQSGSTNNTMSGELEARLTSLTEDVQKLTDEKNTLHDRLKKSNEENLNLMEKLHVSILYLVSVKKSLVWQKRLIS